MLLFVDQSGQLGGAELCLADIAASFGDQAHVLLMADGPFSGFLRQRGVGVRVISLPRSAARLTKKASPADLASSFPALAGHALALRREFRKYDALYLNTAKALLYGVAASAGLRKPRVFHLHDLWDQDHFSPPNIRMLVAAANRTRAVIANSQATADTFHSAGGRAPCHVIPNGFDPTPFDRVSAEKITALRRQFNPEGHPVAAIFGRLSRWKGQDVLIRAALRIPHLTVWIVGDAFFTDDDRAYAEELKVLAAPAGARIRFLGFREDVPALMRSADLIVHASTAAEPFGRVLVEGMLAGKPVIASDAGGPREIVEHGVTGLLVPPGNAPALAEALASPVWCEKMGRAGRARAEGRFGLPAVLAQTREVLAPFLP